MYCALHGIVRGIKRKNTSMCLFVLRAQQCSCHRPGLDTGARPCSDHLNCTLGPVPPLALSFYPRPENADGIDSLSLYLPTG